MRTAGFVVVAAVALASSAGIGQPISSEPPKWFPKHSVSFVKEQDGGQAIGKL